jgi:hypothetical protein
MSKTVKLSRNASIGTAIEMQVQFQALKAVLCTNLKTGALHSAIVPQAVQLQKLLPVITSAYGIAYTSKQGQPGRPGN